MQKVTFLSLKKNCKIELSSCLKSSEAEGGVQLGKIRMNGIDVSHHNGIINWDGIIDNPTKIDFVFIKVSEGVGFKDPKRLYNSTSAERVGLKVGYYHYCTLGSLNVAVDATNEANYFLSLIKTLPKADLPLILDIEKLTDGVKLDKTQVVLFVNTFFDVLKKAGYDYAIYSYTPFLNENLPEDHGLGNIPLWIAAYTNKPVPVLPKGWDKYWIWQCSDKGSVTGIEGKVDLNKMF